MITPPELIPVTTPEPFTVAMDGSLLDQEPPPVGEDNVILLPAQTFAGPDIGATNGDGFTVITAFPEAVPEHPVASLTEVTVYVVVEPGDVVNSYGDVEVVNVNDGGPTTENVHGPVPVNAMLINV